MVFVFMNAGEGGCGGMGLPGIIALFLLLLAVGILFDVRLHTRASAKEAREQSELLRAILSQIHQTKGEVPPDQPPPERRDR